MVYHEEGSEFNCEFCSGLCTIQNGKSIHLLTKSKKCEKAPAATKKRMGLAAYAESLRYRTRVSSVSGQSYREAWREEFNQWMTDDYYHQYKNMTLYMQLHPVDPEIDARAKRGMEYWLKYNKGVLWKRPSEASDKE